MFERLKSLLRPRLAVALFVGSATAMLMSVLPPSPTATVRLPMPAKQKKGDAFPFEFRAVSSNARFLVTYGQHHDAADRATLHVWDRTRGLTESVLPTDESVDFDSFRALFSPDETKLAVAAFHWDLQPRHARPRVISLYDLESGELLQQWKTKLGHELFARDGRLLSIIYDTLSDLETDAEIRRLPKQIGAYHLNDTIGELAVYRKDQYVLLYSWLTGECLSEHDLVGNSMTIRGLSRDGLVISARGWPKTAAPWSASAFSILRDASAKTDEATNAATAWHDKTLSPDGHHLAQLAQRKRPDWLPKWFPFNESGEVLRVTHWTTSRHLAEISYTRVRNVLFSPQGNQLAVFRDDGLIDLYEFPFTKPWGQIAGTAWFAAFGAWVSAWGWTRWRESRKAIVRKPIVPTA